MASLTVRTSLCPSLYRAILATRQLLFSRVLEKNLPTVGPIKAAALTCRRSERVYISGEGGWK